MFVTDEIESSVEPLSAQRATPILSTVVGIGLLLALFPGSLIVLSLNSPLHNVFSFSNCMHVCEDAHGPNLTLA